MEFPACCVVLILLFTTGRRISLMILYLAGAAALILSMAVPWSVQIIRRVSAIIIYCHPIVGHILTPTGP